MHVRFFFWILCTRNRSVNQTWPMCLWWCGQSRLGHGPRRWLPAFPNLVGHVRRCRLLVWTIPLPSTNLSGFRKAAVYWPQISQSATFQLADARWIHWDSGMISPIWFPYVFHLEQSNKLTTLLRSEIIHLILDGYFFMDNEVHPRKPFFLEKWIALSSASKRHVKEIPILRVG